MKRFYLVLLTIVLSSLGQGLWAQNENAGEESQAIAAAVASEDGTGELGSLGDEIRSKFSEVFQDDLGENSWERLLFSFGIILLTYIARKIVGFLFANWLHRIAEKTSWKFDDKMIPAMRGPVGWMVFVIGMFLALTVLNLSPDWDNTVILAFKAASMVVVFWGLLRSVDVFSETMMEVAEDKEMGVHGFIPIIQKAVRTFLFIIAVIMVAQNWG
ncbi:MAG: hypothetical protein ACKVGW_11695, partial [Verrucomicrobiia bacterium]